MKALLGCLISVMVAVAASAQHRELRGIWLVGQDLVKPRAELTKLLDSFADTNFNTVFVDIWWRGHVNYPGSAITPLNPLLKDNPDVISFVVEQCHQRGMKVHFWIGYGFYAYYTKDATKDPSHGPLLDAHPELTAIDSNGKDYLHNPKLGDYYSLCPSNPASHELLGRIMVESITKYPADGVHLDRIRYPESNFCFCDYCKSHFNGGAAKDPKAFLEWKRLRTLEAVRHFEKVVHEARPGLSLTSYVVGPKEKDSKAQAWDLWMKNGLLDAVAVSMYGRDIDSDCKLATEQLGGDTSHLLCAIACDDDKTTADYLANIEKARKFGTIGQVTWYSGSVSDDLDALKSGPYREPAASSLTK